MLSFFFEPTRLLDVVSSFLHGEVFSGWGVSGEQRKRPRSFYWQSYKRRIGLDLIDCFGPGVGHLNYVALPEVENFSYI